VHPERVAGISGTATEGAVSICVSDAYDDEDKGDFMYDLFHKTRPMHV